MGYAFISYSSKNQPYANAIKEFLTKENVTTWMAPGDIPPGSRYAEIINKAIKECACLVLVLSNDSQSSVWVANEVERAINYKKTVIPVKIEDVTLNDEFDFYIGSSQIIALNKIDTELPEVKQFLQSVVTLAGRQSTPDSVTPEIIPDDRDESAEEDETVGRIVTECTGKSYIESETENFLQGLSGSMKKTLTNGTDRVKLYRILGIPKESKVYFIHDATLLHSGKNGFAVWEDGISVKELMGDVEFISWDEFVKEGAMIFEKDNKYGRYCFSSIAGVEKPLFYICGGDDLPKIVSQFLIKLQSGLRDGRVTGIGE